MRRPAETIPVSLPVYGVFHTPTVLFVGFQVRRAPLISPIEETSLRLEQALYKFAIPTTIVLCVCVHGRRLGLGFWGGPKIISQSFPEIFRAKFPNGPF